MKTRVCVGFNAYRASILAIYTCFGIPLYLLCLILQILLIIYDWGIYFICILSMSCFPHKDPLNPQVLTNFCVLTPVVKVFRLISVISAPAKLLS